MANSLSSVPGPFPSASPAPSPSPSPGRHRLRAVVDSDETPLPPPGAQVVDFLPPGATWLPAPPHTLPTLPGQPPMIGYLVLVPADQHPVHPAHPAHPAHPSQHVAPAGAPVNGTPVTGAPASAPVPAGGGPVSIDSVRRTAAVDGRQLDLTYLEFELLAHLVAHPHRVHSRDQLVTTVWGYGHVGDGRTVDVHVARLRRKLGAERRRTIQTVRRVGYKYIP
ncbi:winged helix-turn-helix domain-containing protein [Streptomyces sp. NPDC093085]|uniref:winged helix-turn-helix domain-containing protein n=1 Tax=Streptomyces sp. NPDC093085 TaxID=3155068 RepID=UPI003445EBF8